MYGILTMPEETPSLLAGKQLTQHKPGPELVPLNYKAEANKIKSLMDDDLCQVLEENNCFVAGGACTSVFSNQPVNDIDVYFPNQQAFENVMSEVFHLSNSKFGIAYSGAKVTHATNRSILLKSDDQDVQFIYYKYFPTERSIFNSFDFPLNMCALDLKSGTFLAHANFLKHIAQRYIGFNPDTDYPLISAMRVDKYVKKGYTISKSQMLRILLAVNKKNIDSWEKLADEVGGMYGTTPEEIFDMKQPFSLDAAIEALNHIEYKDTIVANSFDLAKIIQLNPKAFSREFAEANLKHYPSVNFDLLFD